MLALLLLLVPTFAQCGIKHVAQMNYKQELAGRDCPYRSNFKGLPCFGYTQSDADALCAQQGKETATGYNRNDGSVYICCDGQTSADVTKEQIKQRYANRDVCLFNKAGENDCGLQTQLRGTCGFRSGWNQDKADQACVNAGKVKATAYSRRRSDRRINLCCDGSKMESMEFEAIENAVAAYFPRMTQHRDYTPGNQCSLGNRNGVWSAGVSSNDLNAVKDQCGDQARALSYTRDTKSYMNIACCENTAASAEQSRLEQQNRVLLKALEDLTLN
jgi:hypothetical protein